MKAWTTAFLAAPLLLASISISVAAADFSVKFFDKTYWDSSRVEITADPNTHKYNVLTDQTFYADVIVTVPDALPEGATKWTGADFALGWAKDDAFESEYFSFGSWWQYGGWNCRKAEFGQFEDWDGTQGSSGAYISMLSPSGGVNPGTHYTTYGFELTNKMAMGQSADIRLWNVARNTLNSEDERYTTALKSDLGYYLPMESASVEGPYTINSVPEPSSLMAMGCAGVGVLGNLWHRRRKKTAKS